VLSFTCVTFSFSALPFEKAVQLIALLDLDRIDVDCYASSTHVPSGQVRADPVAAADRIRRAADAAGLGVSQLFFTFGMGFADRPANAPAAETRADNFEVARAMVDCAKRCGAHGLTTLPGVTWAELGPERSLDLAVEGLRPIVALAADAGLPLNIEPHFDSVVETPERTVELVERVPGLSLTLDYSHFLGKGFGPEDVHPLLPLAKHFHARHAARHHLQTSRLETELDFADIYRRLLEVGYTGDICLEHTRADTDWGGGKPVDVVTENTLLRDLFREADQKLSHG
jgi:sugar phosphate isomerase/epimerase